MNDQTGGATCSHEEARLLLPWAVTGRLSQAEAARFEAHLAICAECRTDLETERSIREAAYRSPRVEYAPQPSFQKLWTRIEEAGQAAGVGDDPPAQSGHRPRNVAISPRWGLAAAAVLGLAVGWIVARFPDAADMAGPALYRTAAEPDQQAAPGVCIRAVFSPAMTVDELTRVVRESNLTIVEGPSQSGVFGLACPDREVSSVDVALARIRADPRVRFAEPVSYAGASRP